MNTKPTKPTLSALRKHRRYALLKTVPPTDGIQLIDNFLRKSEMKKELERLQKAGQSGIIQARISFQVEKVY